MFQLPNKLGKRIALLALAIFFLLAGVNHFLNPDFYVAIMPPYLPAHLELVYLSGFFEVLGGIAVLFNRTRSLAGWGLVALCLAVFPANIHMAIHPELFPSVPILALFLRLPIQILLIAWAWWATRPWLEVGNEVSGVLRP
jgi:uncharacterized membrane protein